MPFTSVNWDRVKLNQFLPEGLTPKYAVVEDDTNKSLVVNIYTTITKDDATTADRMLARIKIPMYISSTFSVGTQVFVFDETAEAYTAGLNTPPDSQAKHKGTLNKSSGISLDSLYQVTGDAKKNT